MRLLSRCVDSVTDGLVAHREFVVLSKNILSRSISERVPMYKHKMTVPIYNSGSFLPWAVTFTHA